VVPVVRALANALIVDVIEETVFGHKKGIALEGALQTPVGFDPVLGSALLLAHFTPRTDFIVFVGLYDIADVFLRVYLSTIL